jgi:hypothetical protein
MRTLFKKLLLSFFFVLLTVSTVFGQTEPAIASFTPTSAAIGSTTRQAVYQSGTGTRALLFRYAVITGDLDTDGITV